MAHKAVTNNPPERMHPNRFPTNQEQPYLYGEAVEDDHALAASLPPEHSAIDQTGHMDHHRKPIISIHGKDVQEHELDRKNAA
jgi:hypothetical protein